MSDDISRPERYRAAVQLIGIAEASTWARMTSFLTVTGLLIAAWNLPEQVTHGRLTISVLGCVLSGAFLVLMIRSRAYVTTYVASAKRLEDGSGPLHDGSGGTFGFGSRWLAPLVPASILATFVVLAVLACRK
jgi:hypothetical protein